MIAARAMAAARTMATATRTARSRRCRLACRDAATNDASLRERRHQPESTKGSGACPSEAARSGRGSCGISHVVRSYAIAAASRTAICSTNVGECPPRQPFAKSPRLRKLPLTKPLRFPRHRRNLHLACARTSSSQSGCCRVRSQPRREPRCVRPTLASVRHASHLPRAHDCENSLLLSRSAFLQHGAQ
jgi:hypothetical protein